MKAYALLLALTALSLTGVAQPAITWLEEDYNFGIIREQDGKVTHNFRLVNTGDSLLFISNVRTSCGCTASDFTHAPIAAGDTSEVIVTYNPARRPGEFEKDIFVYTNAKPRRSQLTIHGKVLADDRTLIDQYPVAIGQLRLESTSVPLGEVKRGKSRHGYINALNNTLDTLVMRALKVPAHLSAVFTPDTVAPGNTTILSVNFQAAKAPLWGLNIDSVAVSVTPIGGTPATGDVLTMAIVADNFDNLTDKQRARAPHIAVDTDLINNYTLRPDNTYQASFSITNTGHDALEIRRLWSPERAITFNPRSSKIKHGKTTVVDVIVDPSLLDESLLNSRITIITNDPDSPTTEVRTALLTKP